MYNPTKPYKKQIMETIKKTWNTPYIRVQQAAYPVFKYLLEYPEVDHTDGIGTKGVYHWRQKTFKNAALDALAMNLNDLLLVGATPYKLQNHIMIPEDNRQAIIEIIETLADECIKRKIAMTGGETSIHNNMDGIDISATVTGFIKNLKPNKLRIGDVLVGLKSNGLHSNGFTKVREVFGDEYKPDFIIPTRDYHPDVMMLNDKYDIHGMMHITGGAYTKLKDVMENCDAHITRIHPFVPQSIFYELHNRGISDEEMYKTFNCGVGFVLGVSKRDAKKIVSKLDYADIIGEIKQGSGKIIIDSMFSNKRIKY